MAKYDDLKALAKQKEIDEASNREQPQGELMPAVGRALRKIGLMSDDYGTSANPSIQNKVGLDMLDKDVSQADYWNVRKQMAREAAAEQRREANRPSGMKKGGKVKVSSASKRADGIAQRGKTKGRYL